ncbi:hypothetical protein ZIOFF_007013 [Zingiber officinale]|uniref:DUF4378 domain-containing protein n=2 Tax=Zingiber officinale TaxID=94328 RepID=A0A8J5HWF6_ZINOF|nr:hypothetical protein ZIOFF_007013 [Zingiber officinale]
MSAKFLQAIGDDNPELQRQIGCMTGIFQILYRQHIVAGRHLNSNSNNHKSHCSVKEDTKNHVRKHKDSPRSIQLSKSMDALDSTGFDGKSKMHVDLGKSIRILVKPEQSSQYFTETNEPPRRSYEGKKTSLYPVTKVAPRLSYDGRASHPSLDSQESSKFSPKLREFPRLSLDSRECSPKSSNLDFKPNIALKQVDPRKSQPRKMTKRICCHSVTSTTRNPLSHIRKGLILSSNKSQFQRDLRALKHILDAMHAKGLLENDKGEDQPSRTSIHSTSLRSDQCLGSTGPQNMVASHPTLMEGEKSPRAFQSPIVVMKPSRSFSRSGILPSPIIPLNSLRELKRLQTRLHNDRKIGSLNFRICEDKAPESIDRESTNQYLQSTYRKCAQNENDTHKRCASTFHASPRLLREIRGENGILANSSSSISPRLQHKQLERENRLLMYILQNQSPRVRLRRKPAQAQRNDDQLSDTSSGAGSLTQQIDEKSDVEVTSSYCSAELRFSSQGKKNPSRRTAKDASSTLKQSPNRKHDAPSPNSSSGSNQKRLSKVEDLVQKPKQQSPDPAESPAIDHVALLCESLNTDHRYVSEILLTSGLLMLDQTTKPMSMPIQLHPDLFHVLEQTKAAEENTNPEKIHRKLVFDLVNELLIQKLKIASSSSLPNKLVQARHGRLANGQRLLKELCSEIEHLKSESFNTDNHDKGDAMISWEKLLWQSEDWLYSSAELQTVVLEVERCIFRDLIDEVLGEEGAFNCQEKASRKQRAWC